MNQETAQLLQQIGIEKSDLSWTTQVVLILAILLVSYLTTLIFRHLIMPAVRKITARTKATWDDYLFNDQMMKASCRMIPPITWYILLPFAFDDKSAYLLQILLKICLIYLIITALMLIKCFLDSLYEISSEHEALKNRHCYPDRTRCLGRHPDVDFQGQYSGISGRRTAFGQRHASPGRLDYHDQIRCRRLRD